MKKIDDIYFTYILKNGMKIAILCSTLQKNDEIYRYEDWLYSNKIEGRLIQEEKIYQVNNFNDIKDDSWIIVGENYGNT